MPRHITTFSMPWYSIIPAGLGVFMLWAVLTVFNLLGFTNCTEWKFIGSVPREDVRIIGALKNIAYLQTQDGKIYCNTQNGWKECTVPTFVLTHKDAPAWFNPWFKAIPAEAKAVQLTIAGDYYSGQDYFALLNDGQIWSCSKNFKLETERIVQSGAVIWLIIPAAIGLGCAAWFMQIFIQNGSPTQWDFWGRGTKIK
jgi:hypothetical protein